MRRGGFFSPSLFLKGEILSHMIQYCTLASSSAGNCAFLTDGETKILIDLGVSTRTAARELAEIGIQPDEIDAILITHAHGDHVRGLATWHKKYPKTRLLAPSGVEEYLEVETETIPTTCSFSVGTLCITAIPTPHDTDVSVGYRITSGEHALLSVTDLGHVPECLYPYLDGVDLLLIEANYDPDRLRYGCYPEPLKRRIASGHGHLSNPDCAACVLQAVESGTKTVLLGHLSKENNTPRLAYETVHSVLTQNGVIPGVDMMLSVAPRSGHSEWYTVE